MLWRHHWRSQNDRTKTIFLVNHCSPSRSSSTNDCKFTILLKLSICRAFNRFGHYTLLFNCTEQRVTTTERLDRSVDGLGVAKGRRMFTPGAVTYSDSKGITYDMTRSLFANDEIHVALLNEAASLVNVSKPQDVPLFFACNICSLIPFIRPFERP